MGGVFDEPINPAPDITAPSTESLTQIKIDDETMAVIGSNEWYAIAYGNGKYVAISTDGYVTTSTDGSTWTTPQQVTSNRLYDIIFANGKFVAVGTKTVLFSTNGTNWTASTSSSISSAYLSDIAYGNGIFVVSDSIRCYSSTDLSSWTAGVSIGISPINTLSYGNGQFIATGVIGYCASSEDGQTWTKLNTNLGNISASHCAYGNGKFVIATAADETMYTSVDGSNWTEIKLKLPTYMLAKCCGLIFGKSRFVWFGYEYLNDVRNYLVATSSDGENWTDFAPLKDEKRRRFDNGTQSNDCYAVIFRNQYHKKSDLNRSLFYLVHQSI